MFDAGAGWSGVDNLRDGVSIRVSLQIDGPPKECPGAQATDGGFSRLAVDGTSGRLIPEVSRFIFLLFYALNPCMVTTTAGLGRRVFFFFFFFCSLDVGNGQTIPYVPTYICTCTPYYMTWRIIQTDEPSSKRLSFTACSDLASCISMYLASSCVLDHDVSDFNLRPNR